MFEYGVMHLSFRPELQPHGYVFEWHFGLDRELDDVPFHVDRDLPVPPGQSPLRRLAHPGLAAVYLGRRLSSRVGAWNAALVLGAGYVVAVAAAQSLLPSINEAPGNFPATVLWDFRVASLGTQLVMWATLGLLFGALIQRRSGRESTGMARWITPDRYPASGPGRE